MRRVISVSITKWYLLMGAALMAVLLLTMSGGGYARATGELPSELTFVEVQRDGENDVDGLYRPNTVTVSPDNNHVYVVATPQFEEVGRRRGTLVVFSQYATRASGW